MALLQHDFAATTTLLRYYYDRIISSVSWVFLIIILKKKGATAQSSLIRDIRNTYFMNSMKGRFGKLKLIYLWRSEKEIREECQLVLGCGIMVSKTFFD